MWFVSNQEKTIDKTQRKCFNNYMLYDKTVEAEITVIMLLQRARVAESRVKHRLSNGPRRAQSNVRCTEYSATFGHTLVVRDMSVSFKEHGFPVKQGGTADR